MHCLLTPIQKQRRQPSGLASDRWKNPDLHSSHRAPATLFCTYTQTQTHKHVHICNPSACWAHFFHKIWDISLINHKCTTDFTINVFDIILIFNSAVCHAAYIPCSCMVCYWSWLFLCYHIWSFLQGESSGKKMTYGEESAPGSVPAILHTWAMTTHYSLL